MGLPENLEAIYLFNMSNLSKFYKLIKQAKAGKVDIEAIKDIVYSLEDHELPIAQKQLNNLLKKQYGKQQHN